MVVKRNLNTKKEKKKRKKEKFKIVKKERKASIKKGKT